MERRINAQGNCGTAYKNGPALTESASSNEPVSVGHMNVEHAPKSHDRATINERRQAVILGGGQLLPIGSDSNSVQRHVLAAGSDTKIW
jgi:hypothetical protein